MVKLPFKMKINSIDFQSPDFHGEIEFHEKKFPFKIMAVIEKQTIKLPFDVIGIKNQEALVRVSGMNGIYSEDHLKLEGKSSSLEIYSDGICDEIVKSYTMLDTIEIFF